jgi:hypothetical protein
VIFVNSLQVIVGARWGYDGDYTFCVFKKIIRLGFAFFERKRKVGYVIREGEGEGNWIEFEIRICEYAVDSEGRRVFENWLIQGL